MGRYFWPEAMDERDAATLAQLRDLAAIWREEGGGRQLGTGYYVPAEDAGWAEASDVLGLTAKQRKKFSAAERGTLAEIQTWIDEQIALYERKIEKKKKYADKGWKCLEVADERLDDSTPSTNDPTSGATHWVSPAGLPTFDPTLDAATFYSRTYQGFQDRRFPKWARDPSDPEVAVMQKAGSLASNYDEFAVSGVPATEFLFYIGVR